MANEPIRELFEKQLKNDTVLRRQLSEALDRAVQAIGEEVDIARDEVEIDMDQLDITIRYMY